eukprot:571422-Prorocentrum_minimum.AAC.1
MRRPTRRRGCVSAVASTAAAAPAASRWALADRSEAGRPVSHSLCIMRAFAICAAGVRSGITGVEIGIAGVESGIAGVESGIAGVESGIAG